MTETQFVTAAVILAFVFLGFVAWGFWKMLCLFDDYEEAMEAEMREFEENAERVAELMQEIHELGIRTPARIGPLPNLPANMAGPFITIF